MRIREFQTKRQYICQCWLYKKHHAVLACSLALEMSIVPIFCNSSKTYNNNYWLYYAIHPIHWAVILAISFKNFNWYIESENILYQRLRLRVLRKSEKSVVETLRKDCLLLSLSFQQRTNKIFLYREDSNPIPFSVFRILNVQCRRLVNKRREGHGVRNRERAFCDAVHCT